ncbi:MAG: RecX family transcriptional regulator [Actinobacteria bacterium]|nr:RecX family transcriptional regulator [Actinomycetota bacterium]
MPKLTEIRRIRPGHVQLELDGEPWRVVPDDVVVRCGLHAGLELDRPSLRELRRELRRAEALFAAGRVLARRDVSTRRLGERLARARVPRSTADGTIEQLAELGVLDDRRLAARRASSLAARGWGDHAILVHLERDGIAEEFAGDAIAALPPEAERASALAAREQSTRRAAAFLARRGFSEDSIEGALGGRWNADDAA